MILSKLKHLAKLSLSPEYKSQFYLGKELARIKNTARYTYLSTDLLGSKLELVDSLSFYASYKEIFERQIYAFKTEKSSPVIVDGGANVGVSILYFKKLYPQSKVFAFEADPEVFEVLKRNIMNFRHDDVTLINKALWNTETTLDFAVEGSDGGRIARSKGEQIHRRTPVQTVRLREYLEQPIDLLKLDIEGAETAVILDCSDCLQNVENLFIEYHSFTHEDQSLNELLSTLKKSGFRTQIQTQFCPKQPLWQRTTYLGMDLQLNLFSYRS